jgi:hypothetical protein
VLSIKENNEEDVDESVLEQLRSMYSKVIVTDEDDVETGGDDPLAEESATPPAVNEEDASVDALADAFASL